MATYQHIRPDGVIEQHHVEHDRISVNYVQDVQPVLDANKSAQNHNPSGMSKSREWKKIAEVPAVVYLQWIKTYGTDPLAKGNESLLKRLLNDPNWRYLRTSGGSV